MRTVSSRLATVGVALVLAGCGDKVTGINGPPTSGIGVLASIVVDADDRTIQIGQMTQARVTGRDALGGTVALGATPTTWTTSDATLATITAAGVVTGVGVGTVQLRATVADGAASRVASIALVVTGIPGAPTMVDVVMPGLTFSPFETVVKQGGTVRFVFPALAHNVIWDRRLSGAPADIGIVTSVSINRTFPSVGVFPYTCTLHPGMDGTIIVTP